MILKYSEKNIKDRLPPFRRFRPSVSECLPAWSFFPQREKSGRHGASQAVAGRPRMREPEMSEEGGKSRNQKYFSLNSKGFTLIELLVSIGILGLIIALTTGILSRNLGVQRRDIAQQNLQEDVRSAIEIFSREARTGYGSTYALADGRGTSIVFRNQEGKCVMYKRSADKQLERAQVGIGGSDCKASDFGGEVFTRIHSPSTVFEYIRFYSPSTRATSQGLPDQQGFITLTIRAKGKGQDDASIELQTSVTSRQATLFEPL